jgi:MoaA/NifB/PqqE/SkfB family radical SAM enzyme
MGALLKLNPIPPLSNFLTTKLLEFTGTQRHLRIQIDITNACNLKCVHCYHPHHRNEGALGWDQWMVILDQYEALLEKLRLRPGVSICGGEPMTSSLLVPMLTELDRRWKGLTLSILTNGTIIRTDLLSDFRALGIDLQVSLDGPDSDRHDSIRGAGNFERAIRGIKTFRANQLEVHLLAVLSKKTSDWISDFFELARELGATSMNFTRFIPEGFGETLMKNELDRPLQPLELKRAFEQILKYSRLTNVSTNTDQALFHLVDPKLGKHGMMGTLGFVIDYRGNMKVASRSGFVLGNIFENGMENLFLGHPLMQALRDGDIEECGRCQYFHKCGGYRVAAYAATGSFLAPDPGCWYLEEQQQNKECSV